MGKIITRILFPVFCIGNLLSGCTSDYCQNLGHGYVFCNEGTNYKYIYHKHSVGWEIPPTILEYKKNKDFIILDIRGNYGGADLYSLKFFSDLYFNNKNKSEKFLKNYKGYVREVYSLASVQSSIYSLKKYCDISIPDIEKEINKLIKLEKKLTQKPQKIIETNYESKINFNKPAYKGKIIILTDRGVASSGESVLEQAYLFFNKNQVIQIGTNTAGCGSFGNVLSYHLSNSGLQINCGFTDFTKKVNKSNKFHGEGKGFYPDYWCTVNDLSETMESVLNVTKEDELLEIYS